MNYDFVKLESRGKHHFMVYPEFATSFFEKRDLSQYSRGSRERNAIIFI